MRVRDGGGEGGLGSVCRDVRSPHGVLLIVK